MVIALACIGYSIESFKCISKRPPFDDLLPLANPMFYHRREFLCLSHPRRFFELRGYRVVFF